MSRNRKPRTSSLESSPVSTAVEPETETVAGSPAGDSVVASEPTPEPVAEKTPEWFTHPMFDGWEFPIGEKIELRNIAEISKGPFQHAVGGAMNPEIDATTIVYSVAGNGLGTRTGKCVPIAVVVPARHWARMIEKAEASE